MNETFLSIIITIFLGLILLVLFLIGIILYDLIFKKKKKEELNTDAQAREIANKTIKDAQVKDKINWEALLENNLKNQKELLKEEKQNDT